MNEFLVTIVFIIVLVFGVYSYAGYLTRTGQAEDADGNLIPDSWEEKFGWFFSSKAIIMLILGVILGYILGVMFPYIS
jgi:purine-cytosine permease-like protein|tara:strand:- start:352 stop:585 length:234 start_codon:yes stop_codon:yes gene_type:complete